MMNSTPCIALIEDIDNVYHGREYVGAKTMGRPNVSFDCLLNCISGVKAADGVFLIVTTNHVDKLDPAIGIPDSNGKSTRPGRIDKALMLGLMAKAQRLLLAKHILSDFPELVEQTVADGEGETAAQFQARCAAIALEKFWKEGKKLSNETPQYVEAVRISPPKDILNTTFYGKLGNDAARPKSRY
jgi:SpoVK/Ycf46/Vps4 family AAA+-type ATPase